MHKGRRETCEVASLMCGSTGDWEEGRSAIYHTRRQNRKRLSGLLVSLKGRGLPSAEVRSKRRYSQTIAVWRARIGAVWLSIFSILNTQHSVIVFAQVGANVKQGAICRPQRSYAVEAINFITCHFLVACQGVNCRSKIREVRCVASSHVILESPEHASLAGD